MGIRYFSVLFLLCLSGAVRSEFYLETGLNQTDNPSKFSDSYGFSLNAGYTFTDFLSIESGYSYLGTGKDDKDPIWTIETNVFHADLKLSSPEINKFNLYTKVGYLIWGFDVIENNSGTVVKDSGLGSLIGAGAEYSINDKLKIGADYSLYEINDENSSILTFKFGYTFNGR